MTSNAGYCDCGLRDDDWFLCTKHGCPKRKQPASAATSTQHDTPEEVEAMAKIIGLEVMDDDGWPTHPSTREVVEAAAMLRRLHQRAVDAERLLTRAHEALPECYVSLQKDILALINKEPRA